jgi:spermidine/putrescine transport system substrate-binding protein
MGTKNLWLLLLFLALLAASRLLPQAGPSLGPQAQGPLVVYGWAGYMPQGILDAFEAAYGVSVEYITYSDQEEALAALRAGERTIDVVVLGDTYLREAVVAGLLAELNYENIPNFRNLGADFRDLAYDPQNIHSVIIQWGTTGIVARTDRLAAPVTTWADLWNPAYAGKVGVWPYASDLIGIALKSLGYSINSEEPAELAAAAERLALLRKNAYLLDLNQATGAENLLDAETVMIYGWSYDAMQAQAQLDTIAYILPQEGTILWSDSVAIPARSLNKQTAEHFIDFLLEPEISARMVNELWIASSNEAARALIDPAILNNPIVYPEDDSLAQAEFTIEVGAVSRQRRMRIWADFLAAEGPVRHEPSPP